MVTSYGVVIERAGHDPHKKAPKRAALSITEGKFFTMATYLAQGRGKAAV